MTTGFVGKLFGFGKSSPAATRNRNVSSAAASLADAEPAQEPPGALVHRDEILDGRTRISGYRFRPVSLDGPVPTPLAKANALKADNLANFAQRRMAVVPLKVDEWQDGDFCQFVTPNTIFQVEVPPPGGDLASWQAGVRAIRDGGAKVGFDSVVATSRLAGAFGLADAIFIKPADYSIEGFDRLVTSLRKDAPNMAIVVDGVYSWSEFRTCLGMGAHYCLGSFAATPDVDDKGEHLSQSRLILIEMLNLLRGDADLADIAALAKRDPGVALKILEMANSPLAGLKAAVASIDQAIMVLGREALYRWLAVSIFRAGTSHGRDETLLELALRRARFLELSGRGRFSKKECDELFVLGLMSMMDKLLGMPVDQVLGRLPLPACVADALLRGEGPYARNYMLALAMEKGAAESIARLVQALDLDTRTVIENNRDACAWAEQSLAAS